MSAPGGPDLPPAYDEELKASIPEPMPGVAAEVSGLTRRKMIMLCCAMLLVAYLFRAEKTITTCRIVPNEANDVNGVINGTTGVTTDLDSCLDRFFNPLLNPSKRFGGALGGQGSLELNFMKLFLLYSRDEGLTWGLNRMNGKCTNCKNVIYAEFAKKNHSGVEVKLNARSVHGFQQAVSVTSGMKSVKTLLGTDLDYNKKTNEIVFIQNTHRYAVWIIRGRICLPHVVVTGTNAARNNLAAVNVKFRLASDFSLLMAQKVDKFTEEENASVNIDRNSICENFVANGFTTLDPGRSKLFLIALSSAPDVTVFVHNWNVGIF